MERSVIVGNLVAFIRLGKNKTNVVEMNSVDFVAGGEISEDLGQVPPDR